MRRSSSLFLFLDVNVWIALTWDAHVHHAAARGWFLGLDDSVHVCFCRVTQMSFLRLLTTAAVMHSDVRSQAGAWQSYDEWLDDGRVIFLDEPAGIEQAFRAQFLRKSSAPKDWADSYLAAFAEGAGLTLVTFDQGFRGKTKNVIVLAD